MNSYIDIHSHILPKIDDGAENFDVSMRMLRTAYEDGIRTMIVTPHFKPGRHNASPEKIRFLIDKLCMEAEGEGMDMELYPGNEFYYHDGIFTELEKGGACTMAGSSYVLIEFGPMERFEYIRNGLYEALAHGWRPILAHAERYNAILGKLENVEELIQLGSCIQVNAESVLGRTGTVTRQFTKKLLKECLVHFVATDAHDEKKRKPVLSECEKYISKKYKEACAQDLFYSNPVHVIKNEYI